MPNLKHLLDDLEDMGVEPNKVRIPGQLYDSLVEQAETDEDEEGASPPAWALLAGSSQGETVPLRTPIRVLKLTKGMLLHRWGLKHQFSRVKPGFQGYDEDCGYMGNIVRDTAQTEAVSGCSWENDD